MTIAAGGAENTQVKPSVDDKDRRVRFGLGLRLSLALAAAIVTTAAVLSAAAGWTMSRDAHESYASHGAHATGLFATTVGGAVKFRKPEDLTASFAALVESTEGDVAWAAAYSAEGELIASYPADAGSGAADAAGEAVASGAQISFDDGLGHAAPALFGRDNDVVGAVVVGWSDAKLQAQVADAIWLTAALGVAVTLLVVGVAAIVLTRQVSRPLRSLTASVARLVQGEEVALKESRRSDEIGALAQALGRIHEAGAAAQRIRRALDESTALILTTDAEGRVAFVNAALENLLTQLGGGDALFVGADLKTGLSRLGAFEGEALSAAGGAGALTIRDRRFALQGKPILDASGAATGVVLEARDVTEEENALGRIDDIVAAATHGDFSGRIETAGVSGALREASEKINSLVAGVDAGLRAASGAVSALAEGDLTARMQGDFEGGFETLQSNLNASIGRIGELVSSIQGATSAIASASGEILSFSDDLARRAESQAAALEETSATMSEISSSTRGAAERAEAANQQSVEATSRAERGGEVVSDSVAAMKRIQESSGRISEIITVIDGIAFQTNLLALNAAVEAARAGDAGKGFAVVASEVRTLAQRSAEAANDIKSLIQESTDHVSDGVRLVEQTGDSLKEIIEAAKLMADALNQISDATRDQSSGVGEVTAAVQDLDKITQANATAAEQTASSSRTLNSEAERLKELVDYFSTEERGVEAAA